MNFSQTALRIATLCLSGMRSTELMKIIKGNNKSLLRLVRAGIISREPMNTGRRGHPGFWLRTVGDLPAPKPKNVTVRSAPRQAAIISAIGPEEIGIGQIAERLNTTSNRISKHLLQMCSDGKLVRRRAFGIASGKTAKREFFLYRRA